MSGFQKAKEFKIPLIMSSYFLVFMMMSGQFLYLSYFLAGKGLTTQEIGIVVGLPIFISVIGQYFWNNLADRTGITRVTLILFTGAVCVLPLFIISNSFIPLLISTVLYSTFSSSILNMMDTQHLYRANEMGYAFGPLLIPGSFGYLVCVLCLGYIAETNVNLIIVWQIVWGLIALIVLPRCPKVRLPKMKKAAFNPMLMLKKPSVLMVLIIVGMIQFVYGSNVCYFSLYLTQEIGVSSSFIGICCISSIAVEMLYLSICDKLVAKLSTRTLLIGIGTLQALRLFIFGSTDSLLLIWLANSIEGISAVATGFFMMTYFKRVAPPEGKASAIALGSIICTNGIRAFGSIFGPQILEAMGSYQNSYIFLGILMVAAIVIFALTPIHFVTEKEAAEAEKLGLPIG